MRTVCYSVALLILWLPPALRAAPQQTPEQQFAEAVKRHQSGDLQGAIRAYETLLEAYPEHPELRSNLGAAYARLGNYTKAIEHYRAALELDSRNAAIRLNLGIAYYQSAQIPQAVIELAQVVAAQPGNRNAVMLLADCYLRTGEEKKVIELLSPLQTKYPDDRALLYLLGTALIRDNQVEKGQVLVDRILREGDSAQAHLMLGTARMMGRDYRGALDEFARAVELNPKLPSVHSYYGRALLATGDRDRAVQNFRRELEINPNDFDSNLYMGVLLKQDQRFDEALKYLERALLIRPGAPNVRYQIGSLHVSTGNTAEAQRILEDLLKEWPDFVEAHVSLATVYYRLKRKEDGDRHREIVRKLNAERQARAPRPEPGLEAAYRGGTEAAAPSTGAEAPAEAAAPPPKPPVTEASEAFDSLAARASSAREASRIAEAIQLYREALEKRPSWPEGWWYLGTLYYEENRYAEARDAFARLVTLKPEGGVGWAMLGLCQFQLREYQRAYEHLQRARALGVPADTHLRVVSRYHLALLMNRFGHPEAALHLLYGLARKEDDNRAMLEAMGLSALRLPYLPAEIPPDRLELVREAGRTQYLMATRQMAEAREACEELIARHPGTPNVHYAFGVFLLLENPDAALEQFRRELQVSPSHVPARLQIAFEYIKRADYAKGLPYATEAVKLDPKSFAARNALGRILLEAGETERAIQELETGLGLAPDSPEMHFALARAYARVGRKEDAARARDEFQRLDRIRRTAQEGSQAVGGIEPPPETENPPG